MTERKFVRIFLSEKLDTLLDFSFYSGGKAALFSKSCRSFEQDVSSKKALHLERNGKITLKFVSILNYSTTEVGSDN